MSTLTHYQILDLLNRPRPLWLVKVDFSDLTLISVDLANSNLSLANLSKTD